MDVKKKRRQRSGIDTIKYHTLTQDIKWKSDKNTIKHHKWEPRNNLQQNIEQFHALKMGVTINNKPTTTELS